MAHWGKTLRKIETDETRKFPPYPLLYSTVTQKRQVLAICCVIFTYLCPTRDAFRQQGCDGNLSQLRVLLLEEESGFLLTVCVVEQLGTIRT